MSVKAEVIRTEVEIREKRGQLIDEYNSILESIKKKSDWEKVRDPARLRMYSWNLRTKIETLEWVLGIE